MLSIRQRLTTFVCSTVMIIGFLPQSNAYASSESELQNLMAHHSETLITFEEIPPTDQTADELISYCDEQARELLISGITYDILDGIQRINECLKNAILDQVEVVFDPEVLTRADVQLQLDALAENYGFFYGVLYNHNRRCPCGTIQLLRTEYTDLLESILRDVIDVRNGRTFQEG